MSYSILRPVSDDRYCAITKHPEDLRNPARPARGVSMGGKYEKILDFQMSKLVNPTGLQVPDVILNGVRYVIVSARMKELLEKNASGPVELLPFRLLNHKGRVAEERIYVVNVIGTIDCGDLARSKGNLSEFEQDQGAFFDCESLAIDERKVPEGTTLFRCALYPPLLFVHNRVRKQIEEQKLVARFVEPGEPLS